MLELSKAPEIDINWGMQSPENQKQWKNWVFLNLCQLRTQPCSADELEKFASNLFDEIHQLGYDEGYDSAQCDNLGEGL